MSCPKPALDRVRVMSAVKCGVVEVEDVAIDKDTYLSEHEAE